MFQRGLRLDAEDLFQLVLRGYGDDACGGVVEDVGSLLRRVGGLNGNGDGAEGKRREIGDRPLGAIFAEDGDAIAMADTPGFKRAG